jgi:predicted nucleic acid-binding protein
MNSSSFPIDLSRSLICDASVIINLNATGRAMDIIRAVPGSFLVSQNAFDELAHGARNGHEDGKRLRGLVDNGLVEIAQLGESGALVYASLIEGSAVRTLDDGEAATIGHAHETGSIALIDERKARSLCASRFPELVLASTVDLLAHEMLQSALGRQGQVEAILNALRLARMRVPPHQIELIINLIGEDAALTCNSLPRTIRATART